MAKYGTNYNDNRIDLGKTLPIDTPLVIQIEVTGFCNLKCSFCPVNDPAAQPYLKKNTMDEETFFTFLEQIEEFPDSIKVLRFIGNGEPLLNKNISRYVYEAKKSNCFDRVEITTNGTLLTDELTNQLTNAGLDTLKVSLEAIDDETFQKVSGVNFKVDDIFDRLKYFYNNKKECLLYIKMTDIALKTEEKREEFLGRFGKISDYIFIETVTDIWPEYSGNLGTSQRYDRMDVPDNPICIQPFDLLNIFANGDVSPCCADWKRSLCLGNMHTMTLRDMWNGKKMKSIRESLLTKKMIVPCDSCHFPTVSQSDFIDDARDEILVRLNEVNSDA